MKDRIPPKGFFPECTWRTAVRSEATGNTVHMCSDLSNERYNSPCSKRCETPTSKALDQTRGYMKIIRGDRND